MAVYNIQNLGFQSKLFLQHQKKGSESNFDVTLLSAELGIVLNWNLTPFSLPLLVEASLEGLRAKFPFI
jgi:hypothetical protein